MQKIHALQIDRGKLRINVSKENEAIPIENATINVYGQNNQGDIVQIESLQTDQSGNSAEIELYTPPLDYSMIPLSPKPYSTYNILVEAPNYEALRINGVQILPETTAIQNCNMLPVINNPTEETMNVSPHTLYYEYPEKIPEDAIKTLPPPTGFVVLDRVVIPETIVVHDGEPNNAAAPNFYVPFREYIKNVASSEIYATWPAASLHSNILAILSFTLNRVFT